MEIKAATISDWPMLQQFYTSVYKLGHPLQNQQFWQWQFGDAQFGQAFIALQNGEIAGHLGVTISDGYAWHINLFVLPEYRNSNVLLSLIEAASHLGKQGNINANDSAVKLYRLLGWYQYTNLIRVTCSRPHLLVDDLLITTDFSTAGSNNSIPNGHYWQQPMQNSLILADGTTAVVQNNVGALRFAQLVNPKKAVQQAWDLGFNWVDYITSFNNPLLLKLEKQGWQLDTESNIPWLLNPVVKNSPANVTFLTKEPIDIGFYVNRTHSDIGRVGSLPLL